MCDTGSWRQVFCYWTGMLRAIPFSFGRSGGLIEGARDADTGRNSFRAMLGGIEPLSVVVCLVSVLVIVNFMPFVWYFMKLCFRAIKNPDGEDPPQYRQRRQEIHEELHQDMSRQLQDRSADGHEYPEHESEGECVDEPRYRYASMVDSCVQVHPRNFPRRRVSLVSLRHAHSRVATPHASFFCLHQGAAGDTAPPPRYGPAPVREPEYAWQPQRYDEAAPGYSTCHRSSSGCAWTRYPPFSLHQKDGMGPTPRLTRYPLEVTTSHSSTYFKDELTQTSTDDFVEALQKCRMIRQTRSGAVYSVYF